jgi:hypothetical protein
MAGQSAFLTYKEACAAQEKIQHPASQASPKKNASKGAAKSDDICSKVAHQGK